MVIVESSGRIIIQIKKDASCAASAKRRRLQTTWDDNQYENVSWDENTSYGVISATCPMEWTIVNSDHYGSDNDSMQVMCHGQWGQTSDWATNSGWGTGR